MPRVRRGMPWFKHDSGAMNDPKIEALIDHYKGMRGYGMYFGLLEIIAKEGRSFRLETGNDTPTSVSWLGKKFRTTPKKVKEFLDLCSRLGLIDKKSWAKSLIFVPRMRDRADKYTKHLLAEKENNGQKKAETSPRSRSRKEGEVEKKKKEKRPEDKKPHPPSIPPPRRGRALRTRNLAATEAEEIDTSPEQDLIRWMEDSSRQAGHSWQFTSGKRTTSRSGFQGPTAGMVEQIREAEKVVGVEIFRQWWAEFLFTEPARTDRYPFRAFLQDYYQTKLIERGAEIGVEEDAEREKRLGGHDQGLPVELTTDG